MGYSVSEVARNPRARYRVMSGVLAITFAMMVSSVWISPKVRAEPVLSGEAVSSVASIPWPELGLPDYFSLRSAEPEKKVVIPLPAGYRPGLLTGQVEAVDNAVNCRIDVFDGTRRYLGNITVNAGQTVSQFSLDLSRADARDSRLEINFDLRQYGIDPAVCARIHEPSTMALGRLAMTFVGEVAIPVSVADFLPEYLNEIVVRTNPHPSPSVQQATLTLVANLTRLYRPIPVRIEVESSGKQLQSSPAPYGAVRVIEIREDSVAGLALAIPQTPNPTLVISGSGDELRRQVELVTGRNFDMVQAPRLTVAGYAQSPVTAATTKTFDELGMVRQKEFAGTDSLYLGLDASQFGVGSINGAEMTMQVQHTPVTRGTASVLILAGSEVIANEALSNAGRLTVRAHIPAEVVTSNTGLRVELRFAPQLIGSPAPGRISFDIQRESTISVTQGIPVDRGFSMLPMAFTPEFDVALTEPDFLRFAAAAVNLIGQQTASTLRPELTTLEASAGSNAGLLAVGTSEELSRHGLRLPVSSVDVGRMKVQGNASLTVDRLGRVGIVQTQTTGNRTALAISAVADWTLVDRAFDFIRSLPGRWADLKGNVVATGAQAKTVNLNVDQDSSVGVRMGERGPRWQPWGVIFTAVVLVTFTVWWLVQSGKGRSRTAR